MNDNEGEEQNKQYEQIEEGDNGEQNFYEEVQGQDQEQDHDNDQDHEQDKTKIKKIK